MTLSDNMRGLIELLTQGTRKEKIKWQNTHDLTLFRTQLDDGSIELLMHPSGDGFNLLVKNQRNQVLDQTGYISQKVSPELAELSRAIRQSILNSDEALANIISGLRKKVSEP